MRKLLIESGATKSEWCFLFEEDNGIVVESIQSNGWNATSSKEDLSINEVQKKWIEDAEVVYFYGAGVSSDLSRARVFDQLSNAKKVIADSDLKAACYASLGKRLGIVSILGTGSISCLWDGTDADVVVPSLGYLLSDEGSGSDLGKELLRAYFYKQMPEDLSKTFAMEYRLTPGLLIDNLYKGNDSKAYLASFSKFLTKYDHDWSRNLVKERLKQFFDIRILPIYHKKIKNLGFIGSISFVFKDYLTEICSQLEIEEMVFLPAAMEGLINYHKHNNEYY